MTPLEMITEWRKGCSCALPPDHPVKCHECTVGLIDALEHALKKEMTKEEIILLLHEAVKDHPEYTPGCTDPEGEDLEVLMKFAELVSQHEREACAKVVEDTATKNYWRGVNALIDGCADAIGSRHDPNT